MVGPLCCGGFLPPDHELSCLVLTAANELVWLDLPIKRLRALREKTDLTALAADAELDDLLEFGLTAASSHTTPHQDWRESSRWRVPGGDDPGSGVLGAWYRLMRRRTLARGQGELTPRAFLQELHERIDHGVDWVIDGLPPLQAELVRTRAMHLPVVNRLLEQAKAHPHSQAERFAEQALCTLPLGLLDALTLDHEHWRDTLLSGASLRKALALEGITPAVYRLMLRGRETGLADGLLEASHWRVACKALKLIDPADWPRTSRDQQRFASLVERVEWESQHELAHPLIAWCWSPGLTTHQLSVEAVRRAALQLVVMEDAFDPNDTSTMREAWDEYIARGRPKKRAAWKPRYLADLMKMAAPGGEPKIRGKGLTLPGPIAPLLDLKLKDLTPKVLRAWSVKEGERGVAQAARAIQVVSGLLRWCGTEDAYDGLVDPLAARDQKVQSALPSSSGARRTDALEEGQLAAWFAGIEQLRNRTAAAYLQGLLLTGARREELAALKWSDVDFRWKKLTIADKVGDTRTLPLTSYLASLHHHLPRLRDNLYVFASPSAKAGRIADPRSAHADVLKHAKKPSHGAARRVPRKPPDSGGSWSRSATLRCALHHWRG